MKDREKSRTRGNGRSAAVRQNWSDGLGKVLVAGIAYNEYKKFRDGSKGK